MITQFEYDEIQRDIKTDKFEPESPSVIQAIIEAKEVLKSTQLTPRQLLAERSENMAKLAEAIQQRDALLIALERLHASCKPCPECDVEALCYTFSMVAYADAGNAIAAARTHCEERSSSGEAKTSKEGV